MVYQYKWAKYQFGFAVQVLLLLEVELFPVKQQIKKILIKYLKIVFQIQCTMLLHAKFQTDGKNIKLWYFNAQKITPGILDLYLLPKAIQGKVFMIKFSRAPSAIQVPDPEVNVVSREDFFSRLTITINIHSEPLSVSLWYNPCCSTTAQLGCYVAWMSNLSL